MNLNDQVNAAFQKLAKWRAVFAGWQLGTRSKDDPEAQAVRDHREVTMLMRAELNAIAGLLLKKGLIQPGEWQQQLLTEAQALDAAYEEKFPGFKSADDGMRMSREAAETMKGWRP